MTENTTWTAPPAQATRPLAMGDRVRYVGLLPEFHGMDGRIIGDYPDGSVTVRLGGGALTTSAQHLERLPPAALKVGDRVRVVDPQSRFAGRVGIVKPLFVARDDVPDLVRVEFEDGAKGATERPSSCFERLPDEPRACKCGDPRCGGVGPSEMPCDEPRATVEDIERAVHELRAANALAPLNEAWQRVMSRPASGHVKHDTYAQVNSRAATAAFMSVSEAMKRAAAQYWGSSGGPKWPEPVIVTSAPPPRDVYAEIRATDARLDAERPVVAPTCKRCGGPVIHYDPRLCPGPRAEVRDDVKPARLVEAKGRMRCLGEG